ncbi:MAG TPA: aspartate/glutamate racemase family protein [Burkholderiaceae bacterium]|nr:aspartate/glutamate racemase family protein [Burkholderiaceae bacterium]
MPRIALIHALAHSVAPINDALAREWPAAQRMNLLDDSLSADLARSGRLDDAMTARFLALGDYAVRSGADAILFTCSAFGPCIDAVKRRLAPLPVLKPNEAMIDEATAQVRSHGGRIGLLATFAPTLASMPAEFPADVPLLSALADGALPALDRGDGAAHDRAAAQAAQALKAQGCTAIALAQFSLARARDPVAAATGLPVFTTPDSAVRALRRLLA